jgi:hypothetical protein
MPTSKQVILIVLVDEKKSGTYPALISWNEFGKGASVIPFRIKVVRPLKISIPAKVTINPGILI